jgi:hypothetical protein
MMVGWLFTSSSRIFHLYGDITFTGEVLQNLGLCSALRAFEQGRISIVPHLPWFFRSHPNDRRILSPLTTGCGESILTRILFIYNNFIHKFCEKDWATG